MDQISAVRQKAQGHSSSSSKRLVEARRSAYEAEEIGLRTMGGLRSQRESILRTQGHVDETESHMGFSKKLLQDLNFRVQSSQFTVYCLAAVLSVTLLVIVYTKINKLISVLR